MSADNWTTCPKCGEAWREDYELGVMDGEFVVRYSGKCYGCKQGILFEFKRDAVQMLMKWDDFIRAGG